MAMFSFVGAEKYLKDIEDQRRYQEAFDLKADSIAVSQANLKLQQDKFELDKETADFNKLLQLAVLAKAGGGGGLGLTKTGKVSTSGVTTGAKGTKVGQLNISDNAQAAKVLLRDFPSLNQESVVNLLGTTGLQDGQVSNLYNQLFELKTKLGGKSRLIDGRLPEEVVSDITNTLMTVDFKPFDIASLPEALMKNIDESTKLSLENLGNTIYKNFAPLSTVYQEKVPDTDVYKSLASTLYSEVDKKFKGEINAVDRRIARLTQKSTNPETPLNDFEKNELEFMQNRRLSLREIENAKPSATNQQPLFQLYGTYDSYLRIAETLKNQYVFPTEKSKIPFAVFTYDSPPVRVQTKELAYWLAGQHPNSQAIHQKNGWILKPGQKVYVVEDDAEFIIPNRY